MPPIFGKAAVHEETFPESGTGSPYAARLMSHHSGIALAPDHQPQRFGPSRVSNVTPPSTPIRRHGPDLVQPSATADYLAGRRSVIAEPAALPADLRLVRATELLQRQPDACAVLGQHILDTFNEMLLPAASGHPRARYLAPILRMSVLLHRVRIAALEAADEPAKLVVLVGGLDALTLMTPHDAYQEREMAAEDRATAVHQIGTLFGLRCPQNAELSAAFFDDVTPDDGDDEPHQTGRV